MKFTVHKSTFLKVLTPAMGSVSNKNTITSIEGVLIETEPIAGVRTFKKVDLCTVNFIFYSFLSAAENKQ